MGVLLREARAAHGTGVKGEEVVDGYCWVCEARTAQGQDGKTAARWRGRRVLSFAYPSSLTIDRGPVKACVG